MQNGSTSINIEKALECHRRTVTAALAAEECGAVYKPFMTVDTDGPRLAVTFGYRTVPEGGIRTLGVINDWTYRDADLILASLIVMIHGQSPDFLWDGLEVVS